IPYTNLNVSKFELTYENLALDFTASPKLYIILLCGALIASTYNLRYGWDYNGIMMPALLAIACFMPAKVLSTCGESVVVAGIFTVLIKLPLIRDINFGGGRKVVAVFTVGYLTKWIIALVLPESFGMSVTDLFGFGYVLPSMLAVKILQKRKVFLVLLPTLNAAFYSVAIGSLIAAAFQVADNLYLGRSGRKSEPSALVSKEEASSLLGDLLMAKAYVLRGGHAEEAEPRYGQSEWVSRHVESIIRAADPINACHSMADEAPPEGTREMECLARQDAELGPYVLVRERVGSARERRGQGVYLVRPRAKGPILGVPHPVSEPFALEAVFVAMLAADAKALFLAGVDEPLSEEEWTDALKSRGTPFQRLYERLAGQEVVLVRSNSQAQGTVYVRSSMPALLSISELRKRFGSLELSWEPPSPSPVQWSSSPAASLSILSLSAQSVYKAFPKQRSGESPRLEEKSSITGLIERWVVEQKDFVLPPSSGLYIVPRWFELELLEAEVVRRAMLLAQETSEDEFVLQLSALRMVARLLGYEVIWFTDTGSQASYLILKEALESQGARGWGTYVFSLSPLSSPWVWIVPRPLSESGVLGLGARWFERFRGRVLLVPGADWRADPWGKADVLSAAAPRTAIHAALSEVVRVMGREPEFLSLVVRGTTNDALVEPVLVSSGDEIVDETQLVDPARDLVGRLRQDSQAVGVFRSTVEQVGLQGLGNPLSGLVRVRRPGHYLTLWISETERRAVFEGAKLDAALALMRGFNVPVEMGETRAFEERLSASPSAMGKANLRDEELAELVLDFATTSNTAALSALAKARGVTTVAFADLRATLIHFMVQSSTIRCVGTLGKGGYVFPPGQRDRGGAAPAHCVTPTRLGTGESK
ncbi:MAG: poly-gamma-glutamate biosynthesis protein PgsC/CapC, partial [Myxococcota bacterium]|nr:poly-gamma-glutamate biosynthesis protein PgsC/CapC [Myxococcota bacterium]